MKLLGLDTGGLDDLGEPGDFVLDVGGELLGRAGRDLESLSGERALHVRSSQYLHGFRVEPADDRAWGSRGQSEASPHHGGDGVENHNLSQLAHGGMLRQRKLAQATGPSRL